MIGTDILDMTGDKVAENQAALGENSWKERVFNEQLEFHLLKSCLPAILCYKKSDRLPAWAEQRLCPLSR